MSEAPSSDLSFTYRQLKNGTVEILHHGRLASTLRDGEARKFLSKVESLTPANAQQLMARLTGNYKRGNERLASHHPKNKR